MTISTGFNYFISAYICTACIYILFLFTVQIHFSFTSSIYLQNTNNDFYSQVKDLMQSEAVNGNGNDRIIDINYFLSDATGNYIFSSPDYYDLPSDIFENVILDALNDLVDDFSSDPTQFLKSRHLEEIEQIAINYD